MRREVRLRPEFSDDYPGLEPDRWYTAAAVAGQVKGTVIIREGFDVEFADRILSEEHFEFRGGSRRQGSWAGLRTRHVDRHAVLGA